MPSTKAKGAGSSYDDPTLFRARSTITYFVAACRGCPFSTRNIREANIHACAEKHALSVTKHYIMEPPE